jgi:hypothetical protein
MIYVITNQQLHGLITQENSNSLQWLSRHGIQIQLPNKAKITSEWAWAIKMTKVTN